MDWFFIIFVGFFIIIGMLITKNIMNPLTIFNSIWGFIFLLYQLRISSLQSKLSSETIKLLMICIISFSLAFLCFYCFKLPIRLKKRVVENKVFDYCLIKKFFIFWIIIELIETIYSKGLPMIWKIQGSSKTYFDYGIPTVHGLMNAVGLVIIMMAYYSYLYNIKKYKIKNKKYLYIVFSILLFYLLLITRQVVISAIIQMVIIYIFFMKNIPWKKLLILFGVIIIAFGIVGNIRTGYESFLNVALIDTDVNPLFIGVYWVYMYLTMTIANINNAVILGVKGYGAYKLFQTYLPTIITNIIFSGIESNVPDFLVTKAFNVSGFFIEFYTGFGNFGVCIISIVYGLLGGIILKKLNRCKNEKNILYYSIYIQIIVLSFFYNHLLYLPSGFQFFIIYFISIFSKKIKN